MAPLAGHGSLELVFRGLGKPQRAGQCLLSPVWNAVSTRKVYRTLNWTSIVSRGQTAFSFFHLVVTFSPYPMTKRKKAVWPCKTRTLAFNCLSTPFYTPILSPPSTHHHYHYHMQYHYPHEKSCSKQLEFWVFESYSLTQL